MSKPVRWLLAAGALILPGLAFAQTTSDVFSSTASTSADAASTVLGLGVIFGFIIGGIVAFALWILWLFMLVDVVHRQFANEGDKTVWVLVLGILQGIGALIYYFFGRPHGTRPNHDHPLTGSMPPAPPQSNQSPASPAMPDA